MAWYTVTASRQGLENLKKMVAEQALQDRVKRIVVPEQVSKITKRSGETKTIKRRIFEGYVFIEVDKKIDYDLYDQIAKVAELSWVRTNSTWTPSEMSDREVQGILQAALKGETISVVQTTLKEGDQVLPKEGPFVGFEGKVKRVITERAEAEILLVLFGRETLVTLPISLLEKTE